MHAVPADATSQNTFAADLADTVHSKCGVPRPLQINRAHSPGWSLTSCRAVKLTALPDLFWRDALVTIVRAGRSSVLSDVTV